MRVSNPGLRNFRPPGHLGAKLTLLYDGECPVCNRYVAMIRVREQFGELVLLNARETSSERTYVENLGLDLNEGFALFVDEELYYGDRAIQALAMMSSNSGLFNRMNYFVFRHATLSRLLYPILAAGRRLLLRLLGSDLIE
jgi:predicted DCC family thiol-disulfide oxidoreductase YuxK